MNGSAASVAYWILPLVLGVFTIGMVPLAVRKEDRRSTLSGAAPGAAAQATRWLTRFGGSGPRILPRDRAS